MAWTSGTATDHRDLLDKIVDFATANGWTLQASSIGSGASQEYDTYYLSGPGSDLNADVYVNMRVRTNTTNNTTNIECKSAILYRSDLEWGNQPGVSPSTYLCLWPFAMPYWISVSDRRITVTVKVNLEYYSLYAGFFLPFATPLEYPFPLLNVASYSAELHYTDDRTGKRSMCDPGYGGSIRNPDGTWVEIRNHGDGTGPNDAFQSHENSGYYALPYFNGSTTGAGFEEVDLRPAQADPDSRPILPIYIQSATTGYGSIIGLYEGVYWISGYALAGEQEMTIGGTDYIIFQNKGRNEPQHYYVMEQL